MTTASPSRLPGLLLGLTLLALTALPGFSRAAGPVAGTDYVEIADGKRLAPDDGKIEVVEVFGYWCHHCANFEPMLERWQSKQDKDVRVTYLPLPRSPDDPLAIAYFASQSIGGLARSHAATFDAIHDTRALPGNPTIDEIGVFYAGLGLDEGKFKAAVASPAIKAKVVPAREFALGSGVEGTPTLIVNGRYRVTGRTLEDNLRIAGELIERERAAAR